MSKYFRFSSSRNGTITNRKTRKYQSMVFNLLSLTTKVISWILAVLKPEESISSLEFTPLINSLHRASERGGDFLLDYIKKVRQALLLHFSGEYPTKRVDGIKLYPNGLPKALGSSLSKHLASDPVSTIRLRLTLTILFCTRALRLGRIVDVSSITAPQTRNSDITKHIHDFWTLGLGYRFASDTVPRKLRFKKFHFTTKSGPNGHALFNSTADLYCLPEKLVSDIKIMGGDKLSEIMEILLAHRGTIRNLGLPTEGRCFRKIVSFPDMEAKIRVIAVGDYWSQTVLKPLHHYMFRILKKIPQDCTFNQGSFINKIEGWTEFYSIDLTAWTDRFPITLVSDVMKGRLPVEYCDAWKRILVDYPFDSKQGSLTYAVGTPMGFYTSWSNSAVAHHYVMYYCCRELNIDFVNSKYVLLGDDILIGDRRLAEMYKEVIQSLGCEFSPLKTHESLTLAEFAKRYVLKGVEITPFPISALGESQKHFCLMVNLLCELEERGWAFINEISSVIYQYYDLVHQHKSKHAHDVEDKSYICERIMKVIRGQLPAYDAVTAVIGRFQIPLTIQEEEGLGILQSLVVEAFADSNPANAENEKYKGRPLGLLAENLVLRITSIDRVGDVSPLEPYHIPILQAYGLIEEMYMDLMREARRIDTVGGGEWPLFMRSIALPLDDMIFVQRSDHLIARASAMIGDKLLDRLKLIASFYN